jgi:uncharacterized protein
MSSILDNILFQKEYGMADATLHRAFRFLHPDLDQPGTPPGQSGLLLDLHGAVTMVAGDDSVRQSVLLLLSTRPGERLMRPSYGCSLNSLVFSPNDDTTAAIAIHHARQALLQWEPRIDILTLDAHRHPAQPEILVIVLKYQVRTTQQIEELHISLDLTGGGA